MPQIKEIKSDKKKVLIFRSEDKTTKNGFNYYLLVFTFVPLYGGYWAIDDGYKQKLDILSLKVAERIAEYIINQD